MGFSSPTLQLRPSSEARKSLVVLVVMRMRMTKDVEEEKTIVPLKAISLILRVLHISQSQSPLIMSSPYFPEIIQHFMCNWRLVTNTLGQLVLIKECTKISSPFYIRLCKSVKEQPQNFTQLVSSIHVVLVFYFLLNLPHFHRLTWLNRFWIRCCCKTILKANRNVGRTKFNASPLLLPFVAHQLMFDTSNRRRRR